MNPLMPIELITARTQYRGTEKFKYAAPTDAPCEDCPCEWVCAGCEAPDKPANWSLAMACSKFKQYTLPTKACRTKMKDVNQMPSRAVYVQLFE